MIPIENSVAGRVADIHHLLPDAGLHIVGEHFLRVRHQLMALPGASLLTVKRALSHTQALGQCRNTLRKLGLTPVAEADTAGLRRASSRRPTIPSRAAIATALAAEIYGLKILMQRHRGREAQHDALRRARRAEPDDAEPGDGPIVTTFIFRVRNVPAALYKAMGGFATNGVNMTKLESYQLDGRFVATSSTPTSRATRTIRRWRARSRSCASSPPSSRSSASTRASPYRAEANKLRRVASVPIPQVLGR